MEATEKQGDEKHQLGVPNLKISHRSIWNEIERAQPYRHSNKWLRQFIRIVNDNKHWDLVAQRSRRAAVGSPGAERFGPVTFLLQPENVWVEYRFKGIDADAFFLLMESLTNIREIVYDIQVQLR